MKNRFSHAFEVPALSLTVSSRARAARPFRLVIDQSIGFGSGELVCVMGANGSGKSTFLHLLSGISTQTFKNTSKNSLNNGSVLLWQRPVSHYSLLDLARMRATLQQFEQISSLSVEACVRLSEYPFGPIDYSSEHPIECSMDSYLTAFGLQDLKQVPLDELSGGQRQRVHLARVFWQCELMFGMKLNPPILIMDEPMNHLDFNGQRQLIAQLLKLKERGALVIVSSHLLDIVHVASRCVLFDCGRLMRDKQWSDESLAQRMAWVAQVLSPLNQEGLVS